MKRNSVLHNFMDITGPPLPQDDVFAIITTTETCTTTFELFILINTLFLLSQPKAKPPPNSGS